jgi:putative membrane protein
MGEVLFSAHMAQHELIIVVAAPLLVLGRPMIPFLWAMPMNSRRVLGRWTRSRIVSESWVFVTRPLNAFLIHLVVLWVWHVPALFQKTLTSDLVHTAQHSSFLFSALTFWWALIRGHGARNQYGTGALYLFATMLHTGLLGALLTFSSTVWYPDYADSAAPWGLTPLEDQQLAGLIMWVPPGVVYPLAALLLLAHWLKSFDAYGLSRERQS